nr:MAG TPA: DNA-directed RNA polymerase [Caudoviricetes sp.]
MAEYIDRGTAIAKLTALDVIKPNATMVGAKRLLAEIPTADVAPVVHERWEPCFDENCRCRWGFGKCSNCGQEYYAHAINHYKYCPNCGAKMDGGGERDG